MVVSLRGTRIRSFLACSTDFLIASGTSRALPSPTPTCPRPSPTTTSAVKENRRPPLTTFATRLMATTRSVRSSALASIRASATHLLLSIPLDVVRTSGSELEAACARCVRERLDPPMILIAAAVEHGLPDPAVLGFLCDDLADDLRGRDIAAELLSLLEFRGSAICRRQRLARRVIDELRVDVVEAPKNGQPRALGRPLDDAAYAHVPNPPALELSVDQHYFAPAFLPTFRRMCSSAYLMP